MAYGGHDERSDSPLEQAGAVQPVRIFLSSPGDLMPERAIIKRVVDELNRSPLFRQRFKLDAYAYEDSTPARAGLEPQVVVEKYLLRPEEADILICMFWLRMGTPQPVINPETNQPYQSGTEYEFLSAYRASMTPDVASGMTHGGPLLLLYRCTRPPKDMKTFNLAQYDAVQGFFARFRGASADLKALMGEFKDRRSFKEIVRRDLELLLADLAGPATPPTQSPAVAAQAQRRPLYFLPDGLPAWYVKRPETLEALRAALLGDASQVGIVGATALHGMGGLGKTTLARAICDDLAIRAAYPDGILWATLGQRAEPVRHQRDWIRALGGEVSAASSVESGKVELQQLLQDRSMLLVLDDVWHGEDVQALQVGGTHCTVLATTRDAGQVEGAHLIPLGLMHENESIALLRQASGGKGFDEVAPETIARRLGYLPLALKVVGSLLGTGVAWTDIDQALDEGDVQFVEHNQRSVLAVIDASVRHLEPVEQECYHALVIFPRAQPLDVNAIIRLWSQQFAMKARECRKLLTKLQARALIQADMTLHDLQHDYLRGIVSLEEQQRLHAAFVDSYGNLEAWARLPDKDRYAWRSLPTHVALARRHNDLRMLLTNMTYLTTKIEQLGTEAAAADYALLDDAPLDDELLARIAAALRLSAHVLDRAPSELANQLFGRLGSVAALHHWPPSRLPSFQLASQTLTPPGGPLLRVLAGHHAAILRCSFSPSGELMASASSDGTLRLWEPRLGRERRAFPTIAGGVNCCAFSPNGLLVACGCGDRTLYVLDVQTGRELFALQGHAGRIWGCAFSPDGRLLASASEDRMLRLWDVESGRELQVLRGHRRDVSACVFSPSGTTLASVSGDGTLRLWEVESGRELQTLSGHTGKVWCCTFSPDGRLLASAGHDRTLRLWDAENGREVRVLTGHTDTISDCAFSPDGRLLASAGHDRTLRLWEVESGRELCTLRGHSGWVIGCAFSPDGTLLVSASGDRTLRVWDVTLARRTSWRAAHRAWVTDCAFSPDGTLLVSASGDRTLRVQEVETGRERWVLRGHRDWLRACAFSPDGRLVASASDDRTARLWDVEAGRELRVLRGHDSWLTDCAFDPEGRLLATASTDRTLRLWDVETGRELRILRGHSSAVRACTFSPDGRLLASASKDHTLRLWDVETGRELSVLRGHTSTVRHCAFSPNGRVLASVSKDRTVRLWDVDSGVQLHTLGEHGDGAWECAFSPDGCLLISVSGDRTLHLWDVNRGKALASWLADAPLSTCAWHPLSPFVTVGDTLGNLHFLRVQL